jgi:5-methyltetrahydrofolate--homocysteine methyltransferase
MADLKAIAEALTKGQAAKVKELVQQALGEKIAPEKILNESLLAGMDVVGKRFKANEIYIPEVLIAARAMHAGMDIIKPLLSKKTASTSIIVAVGTVKGDLHDIGKNLVCMMLEGAGFEVLDLGIDVPPEKFIDAVKNKNAKVIGMSALLTTTMTSMKGTIDALKASGLKDKVKVMVGGAPVTQSYADEIGADGYASDAASAADKARELARS